MEGYQKAATKKNAGAPKATVCFLVDWYRYWVW